MFTRSDMGGRTNRTGICNDFGLLLLGLRCTRDSYVDSFGLARMLWAAAKLGTHRFILDGSPIRELALVTPDD